MKGPDFVGIGAPRAGTSWLHEVLSRHPALWVPPIKELHYFDEPQSSKRYYTYLRMRLITGLWIRRPLSQFDLRYFIFPRNDGWYCDLFAAPRRRGLIVGEITPAYSTLEESTLRRLWVLNPNVKLIYIMRDPVMRSWSAVMKRQRNLGLKGTPTVLEAIGYARSNGVLRRSNYLDNVERFERVFRRDQIFYEFFERVSEDPGGFVADVLHFIGVEPGDVDRIIPPATVNAAANGLVPPAEFVQALAADYLPWMKKLSHRFEGAPKLWYARYKSLLTEPPGAGGTRG
jgi:hypothetical protein